MVLCIPRGVLPVGEDDARRVHRALAELRNDGQQALEAVAVRVLHEDAYILRREALAQNAQAEACDRLCHDQLIAGNAGVCVLLTACDMAHGGVGDEHACAVCVGFAACLVFFARNDARDHIRLILNPDRLSGDVVAAEQRPGKLLVENDAVIGKVAV